MTYTELVVVAVLAALALDLLVLRTGLVRRRAFWTAYAILAGFQLLVNGTLTGLRIVRYDPGAITGLRIAFAPVEDLGFGFALILLTLSLWVRAGRGTRTGGSVPPLQDGSEQRPGGQPGRDHRGDVDEGLQAGPHRPGEQGEPDRDGGHQVDPAR